MVLSGFRVWKIEKVLVLTLGLFQLIQTLKSDFPTGDFRKTSLPALTRQSVSGPPPTTKTNAFASQSLDLPRSIGNPTRIQQGSSELSSLEDVSLLSQPHYRSNKSIMDSESDEDAHQKAPVTPNKKAKVSQKDASPKRNNLGQLNAYGIPLLNNTAPLPAKTKSSSDISDRIRVCVRKRPLAKKEVRAGQTDIAPVTGRRGITILEPKY